MNRYRILAVVGAGSGLGALARVALGDLTALGTLVANLSGSFLIGVYATSPWRSRPLLSRFVMDGFCGGFTTFSIFSLEVVQLAQQGAWGQASAYSGVTVICAVLAVATGVVLGRRLR